MSYGKLSLAMLCVFLSVTSAHGQQATCATGYVWREAFQGDRVCVPPATREQAASENRQAAARREPGGGAYGPDTCRPGYVWREARPDDHVCVTPETRAQAAADNREANNRLASSASSGKPSGGGAAPQRTCTLYEHRDFAGARYTLQNGDVMYMIRNPDPGIGKSDGIHRFRYEPSWNDKLSSFQVEGGCTLTLWENVNEGGHHFTSNKNYSYVGDAWNDKASQADCSCPGLPNF